MQVKPRLGCLCRGIITGVMTLFIPYLAFHDTVLKVLGRAGIEPLSRPVTQRPQETCMGNLWPLGSLL